MSTTDNVIDPSQYLRFIRGDVPTTIALVRELSVCIPPRANAKVQRAAKRMQDRAAALQARYVSRQRIAPVERVRPYDQAADNAWGTLFGRLDSLARIPESVSPRGLRAAQLRDTLFPTGLRFLTIEFKAQWVEGEVRIQRIESEGLAKDIEQLAGADVLEYLRTTHQEYGEALGLTRRKEQPETAEGLWAPLDEVYNAISAYALQVAAMWEPEADDAESVAQVVRAALGPIGAMRERSARKGSSGNGEGKEEPAPEPTPAPTPPADPKDPIKK